MTEPKAIKVLLRCKGEDAESRVTAEEFTRVVHEGLPSGAAMGFEVVTIEHGIAVLRMETTARDLRPGDTVAGPVLFGLADVAMYAVVMSAVGPARE